MFEHAVACHPEDARFRYYLAVSLLNRAEERAKGFLVLGGGTSSLPDFGAAAAAFRRAANLIGDDPAKPLVVEFKFRCKRTFVARFRTIGLRLLGGAAQGSGVTPATMKEAGLAALKMGYCPSKFRGTPDYNENAALHSYGLDAHCRSVLRNPDTG